MQDMLLLMVHCTGRASLDIRKLSFVLWIKGAIHFFFANGSILTDLETSYWKE